MSYNNAREKLDDNEVEIEDGLILVDEDIFIDSMTGISHDGMVVYDYSKMVEEFVKKTGCSIDDAADYVSNG
ncbi:hypothetical protein RCJ22_30860, partial [Vibrio sp. FNV 38]|nr:hypothetical protein [Vibrio sp. FNV 38]